MRVAITAGGTGGHVYPAVAVATALLARGDQVHWIGRPDSLEESEARALGADFSPIRLLGLKRRWSWENVRALICFVRGRRLAREILQRIRAEVLFALGSYVSAPAISAALSLRLPVLVHEQNVVPGLVVRAYARKVAMVLLAKPLAGKGIEGRARVVGMPLRPGIVLDRREEWYLDLGLSPSRKTLFIFGGSQGARSLCTVGLELARNWNANRPDWQILLQTGRANLEWVQQRGASNNLVPVAHLHEMGKAYACADVVVARSGAVSCAELEAVGKPAVLVPFPSATQDHQRLNAEEFLKAHAGILLAEDQLDVSSLDRAVMELAQKQPLTGIVQNGADPVGRIVSAIDEIARGRKP
ncbi:MAG: UDP-N-acetylglucosamine--N-acetylmuramyl-(pentapeptide) pyrophosphoryl-undecaprenol N-acetylglucosamine transferase [bacterium]|nr:UDP-N-acetylglucosamine--N-acetylmuramyl-(pentapeptide) pyrophosphoryl-undecaprenol N-acetylglucosamine transferase [bacterium]